MAEVSVPCPIIPELNRKLNSHDEGWEGGLMSSWFRRVKSLNILPQSLFFLILDDWSPWLSLSLRKSTWHLTLTHPQSLASYVMHLYQRMPQVLSWTCQNYWNYFRFSNYLSLLSLRLLGEVQSPECVTTSTTAIVPPTTPTTTTSTTTSSPTTYSTTTATMTTERTRDFEIALLDSHNVPTQNALSEELLIGEDDQYLHYYINNNIMFQVLLSVLPSSFSFC